MISVCMATYNGAEYIKEQIHSILTQLSKSDELIISDDCSTDATVSIIESIQDSRICLLPITGNKLGVIRNFENAILHSKGEYVFLSDQDDVWLDGKVKDCIALLATNLMVITDCLVVNNELRIINKSFFSMRDSKPGFFFNLWKNSYLGCCMAFRRELLEYALPIPKNAPMHDIWFGLMAQLFGVVHFLPKQLLMYRRHSNNASLTATKGNLGFFKIIKIRANIIFIIISRLIKIYSKKSSLIFKNNMR